MLSLYAKHFIFVIICSAEDLFTLNSNKFRGVYKVYGNPQLDSRDWSMYSNILKLSKLTSLSTLSLQAGKIEILYSFYDKILFSYCSSLYRKLCVGSPQTHMTANFYGQKLHRHGKFFHP